MRRTGIAYTCGAFQTAVCSSLYFTSLGNTRGHLFHTVLCGHIWPFLFFTFINPLKRCIFFLVCHIDLVQNIIFCFSGFGLLAFRILLFSSVMPKIINIPDSCMSISKWKRGCKSSDNRNRVIERHILFIIVKYNRYQTQSVLVLILTNDSLGLWAESWVFEGGCLMKGRLCFFRDRPCVDRSFELQTQSPTESVFKEVGIMTKVISEKMRFLIQRCRMWRNHGGKKRDLFPGHLGSDDRTRDIWKWELRRHASEIQSPAVFCNVLFETGFFGLKNNRLLLLLLYFN